MKINRALFCLPPYLSTTWSHVMALHMRGEALFVSLADGEIIQIPNLPPELLQLIFENHGNYLEEEERLDKAAEQMVQASQNPLIQMLSSPEIGTSSLRFAIANFDGAGGMYNALQHNAGQSQLPNLPPEILEKILSITKLMASNEPDLFPPAEPHCNCIHCQITRAMQNSSDSNSVQQSVFEEVEESELTFQQFNIEEVANQIFKVTNRLENDCYIVELAPKVRCSCGQNDCEHIINVLKS